MNSKPPTPEWTTSSHSNNGGACVEIATNLTASHATVPVRDSKNPAGPQLAFPTHAFSAFLAGVRAGQLGDA